MSAKLVFRPKEGGEAWVAQLGEADFSGYDIVLMVDRKNGSADSGWMLELGVQADGSISGQITARPGYDVLVLFDCTQHRFTMTDNWAGPPITIDDSGDN